MKTTRNNMQYPIKETDNKLVIDTTNKVILDDLGNPAKLYGGGTKVVLKINNSSKLLSKWKVEKGVNPVTKLLPIKKLYYVDDREVVQSVWDTLKAP